jgi:hypothetical protein
MSDKIDLVSKRVSIYDSLNTFYESKKAGMSHILNFTEFVREDFVK